MSSNSNGELGALACKLYDTNENLSEEDAFEAFVGWAHEQGIELWPHQEEALMSIMVGDHVILGTPTGSGKSLVALGMHFMAMCFGETSYYTAPIKALVSEKFFNLVRLLGKENVGMITGDVRINIEAPVICCTQEILANLALRTKCDESGQPPVHSVAVDEFHFFADSQRGWAWQVPLLTLPKTQFLLMSATLGDMTQIEGLLKRQTNREVSNITDAKRPIPLEYEYMLDPLEVCVKLAIRADEGPIYVVHFAQDAALKSAQALASFGVATKQQRAKIKKAMKGTNFNTAFGKTLKRLLGCGVGVHHAGLLPRYRLLVEKLAQAGHLPVICGTDTLGVGINVPIHTVLFTQLTKFDGNRERRIKSREFHQIAGRAGRSGFDTEGKVLAMAPPHEIENHKMEVKAGGNAKKLRRIKKKKPPLNFVMWSKVTFDYLINSSPLPLQPHLKISHSMMLAMAELGGNVLETANKLIESSLQPPEQKLALQKRACEILQTLLDGGVVVENVGECGQVQHSLTVELPDDFALDQPLSPFLLAALELLEPESETYDLDVISMVEATLENPRQILRIQQKKARDKAMAEMKMNRVDYFERLERIKEITYEKPLEELLDSAFTTYCKSVPWARDFSLNPKSILRDMIECAADFKTYIQKLGIMRYEGILLRYLTDAYRVLSRTVPADKLTSGLDDIIAWLGVVVTSVDSSLLDEWAGTNTDAQLTGANEAAPVSKNEVVRDRRGLMLLVRNAMFARVRAAAARDVSTLAALDADSGFSERVWQQLLDKYYEIHSEILLDADARSSVYFIVDTSQEKTEKLWHVRQIFHDEASDNDFVIIASIDLVQTQESDGVVFSEYRAGFVEDI